MVGEIEIAAASGVVVIMESCPCTGKLCFGESRNVPGMNRTDDGEVGLVSRNEGNCR